MKNIVLIAFALFVGQAQAIELTTAKGIVDVPKNPKVVASLDIGTIDTLNALEVPVKGIPDNLYIDELNIKDGVVVGNLFKPDIEKLYALKPDLILMATLSAGQISAVSKIAPAVDMSLENKDPFTETLERMQQLATVFDKQAQASKWQEKFLRIKNSITSKLTSNNRTLILLTTGNKMSVFGSNSRFGWLDKTLGFHIVKTPKDTHDHGAPVSFEYIKKVDPDWLLVIDRASAMGMHHEESAKSLLDNTLMRSTRAWKNKRIIYLRPADMYVTVGGVQSMYRVMQQLEQVLNP